MSVNKPLMFKFGEGINAYEPELVKGSFQFTQIMNVDARLARLITSKGYSLFQDLELDEDDRITGFGYYTLSTRQFSNFYAFSRAKVFWLNFETGQFDTTEIYEFPNASDSPPVILPWFDSMYITKPFNPYVKLEYKTATVIAGAPSARYGIVANSHAMLANVGEVTTQGLARIRWSDLDAPESFVLDPLESEADFFDLEPGSLQITGLSYQRGSPIAYSQNDLWAATYLGFPGSFKWEPIIPGLGNIFHNAVVRNKDVDYFIGADNIYALNGLQPVEIGEKIFERFINDVKITSDTSVRGYLDSRKNQVFWVYIANDDSLKSIVYNYKEQKWTERDPQEISAWFDTPRVSFRGYKVIDDFDDLVDDIIDDQDALIDDPDAGFPLILPQLVGTRAEREEGGEE